jgi:hypothetical protein
MKTVLNTAPFADAPGFPAGNKKDNVRYRADGKILCEKYYNWQ